MFVSTYGFERVHPTHFKGSSYYALLHKAINVENSIEIFEIGDVTIKDSSPERIFCLRNEERCFPFRVTSEKKVGSIPMADFLQQKDPFRVIESAYFLEVEVAVSHLGVDISNSIGGALHYKNYMNVWGDDREHTDKFNDPSEARFAFSCIQEALPILYFEKYHLPENPAPRYCVKVSPKDASLNDSCDSSGALEKKSLIADPSAWVPRYYKSVLESLVERSQVRPLSIEELMAEMLNLERAALFKGSSWVSTPIRDESMVGIFKRSYAAYYGSHYPCFEMFMLAVADILKGRIVSRRVYERYCRPAL